MSDTTKVMKIYHRWPKGDWNMYVVTAYEGEQMLKKYPQYYSRESNRTEREDRD